MLLLNLLDSYLLLFVGWEGVGLASYLLIGLNYNPAYATAANKAFFVNRVGDLGLATGIMLMFVTFGGVDYAMVSEGVAGANRGAITAWACCSSSGPAASRLQFPLQSWLGDAMAGPTPVSASSTATMVTAGVYLIVRSDFIYNATLDARLAVALVDHPDLRGGRRLCQGRHQEGPGGLDDEPDRLHDAGRRARADRLRLRDLPPAHPRLLQGGHVPGRVGHARHAGPGSTCGATARWPWSSRLPGSPSGWAGSPSSVPPFSGFWSKDKIIESAFVGEGWQPRVLGGAAMVGAGITAFYMSRLFFMTFHGRSAGRTTSTRTSRP